MDGQTHGWIVERVREWGWEYVWVCVRKNAVDFKSVLHGCGCVRGETFKHAVKHLTNIIYEDSKCGIIIKAYDINVHREMEFIL